VTDLSISLRLEAKNKERQYAYGKPKRVQIFLLFATYCLLPPTFIIQARMQLYFRKEGNVEGTTKEACIFCNTA